MNVRHRGGAIIAGEAVGGRFAPTSKTPSDGTGLRPVSLVDSYGSTVSVVPGKWDSRAANLFQTGQCVAFAVEHADRTPGAKVRIYWRVDSAVEHAVVMDPLERKITDSISCVSEEDFHAMWSQTHDGDEPEFEDFSADEVRGFLTENDECFALLPEQDFDLAASFMDHLPQHLKPALSTSTHTETQES